MGRRFRRQLVKLTRRIARICHCCGTFPTETEEMVVPVVSVIGTSSSRQMNSGIKANNHDFDSPVCSGKINYYKSKESEGLTADHPSIPGAVYSSSDCLSSPTWQERSTIPGISFEQQSAGKCSPSRYHVCNPQRNMQQCYQALQKIQLSTIIPVSVEGRIPSVSPSNDEVIPNVTSPSRLSFVELNLRPVDHLPPTPIVTSNNNWRVEHAHPDFWRKIVPSDWTTLKTLSKGTFGIVQLSVLTETGQKLVVKTCSVRKSRLEVAILTDCQSPYVVKLFSSIVLLEKERYMCMRYYEHGDLHHWLILDENRNSFSTMDAIWIISYLLVAAQHLHDNGVMHLDIKPQNILIDTQGYPLLADFGSARRSNDANICQGLTVTFAYASPEVLRGEQPTELADLWAIACSFYEIIKGSLPFGGYNDADIQLKRIRLTAPELDRMSPEVADFLTLEFHLSRMRRLGYYDGASSVMRHRIFDQINWEDVRYGKRQKQSQLIPLFDKLRSKQQGRSRQQTERRFTTVSTTPRDSDILRNRHRKQPRKKKLLGSVEATRGRRASSEGEETAYFGDNDDSETEGIG